VQVAVKNFGAMQKWNMFSFKSIQTRIFKKWIGRWSELVVSISFLIFVFFSFLKNCNFNVDCYIIIIIIIITGT